MTQKKLKLPADTLAFLKSCILAVKGNSRQDSGEHRKIPSAEKSFSGSSRAGLRSFSVGRYCIMYREGATALEARAIRKMLKDKHAV